MRKDASVPTTSLSVTSSTCRLRDACRTALGLARECACCVADTEIGNYECYDDALAKEV